MVVSILISSTKSYLAANFVLAAANTSIRISVLHFYITIFRSNKAFLTVAYAVIALVLAFFIGVVVSDVLTCRPLAKYWDPLQPGTCESPLRSLIALSSTNVATDLTIVLLPMPMVWGLQMATRRKVELTITFALGFLYVPLFMPLVLRYLEELTSFVHSVCVLTIIRLILSIQINLNDFTYGITKISIVTIPEPLLGIVVACLPLFPPALKKITGRGRKTNPETRNVLSSSMARLRLKRSKNSSFQRFDDSLALTDIENNKTHNSITGPSSDADAFDKDYNELRGVGSIKIKQDWEVRSDEAKHLEAKVQI